MSATERIARCTTCGSRFFAAPLPSGRRPKTCSPACRAEAMRRMAGALIARADKLEAELEDGGE